MTVDARANPAQGACASIEPAQGACAGTDPAQGLAQSASATWPHASSQGSGETTLGWGTEPRGSRAHPDSTGQARPE